MAAASFTEPHGGNGVSVARRLGCRPEQLLDASASLAPLYPSVAWVAASAGAGLAGLRPYPDRSQASLREAIARIHGLDPASVLPGNGAAELFTWAGRDAATAGMSAIPAPGFADYSRAIDCFGGAAEPWPLAQRWDGPFPEPLPAPPRADVIWITNPHNPTGQLWSRASLEPLLQRHALVICDEAFLPLVPGGETQSLIPLVSSYPNLVVVRSLTKLYGLAGLRLGYAIGQPERLQRWATWRDPWPVNGLATAIACRLLADPASYRRHCRRVQRWSGTEMDWLQQRLGQLPGLTPMPSAANYFLLQADHSLVRLREALEQRHQVLVRDCRSFAGLGERWLRIGLQRRSGNRRLLRAVQCCWPDGRSSASR